MGLGAAGCTGTRRWVEVTKPIPQVQGETLADELVDDGGDATLWMHKGTEMEDAFTKDGSLPDPERQAQIKGLKIKWRGTEQTERLVSRRLALRPSSRIETTRQTFMEGDKIKTGSKLAEDTFQWSAWHRSPDQ